MIKVSIIVPVHNGEKFLRRCLNSLVEQTLKDIEIIVIDDGSSDSTWNLIIEYQDKYQGKIRGYRNKINIGTGSTRNVGLSLAQGDYIIFVDSDDWVSLDYCERLWEKAIQENADVVYCTAHQVDANSNVIYEMIPPYKTMDLKDPVNKRKLLVDGIHNTIAYWNQLVRRDIYTCTGYRAMEGAVFNEDYMLACVPFLCEKIAVIDTPLYFQEKRSDSVFYSEKKKFDERVKAADHVLDMAKTLDIFQNNKEEWEYLYIVMIFLNSIPEFLNRKLYFVYPMDLMQKAVAKIAEKFPEFTDNKYLLISPFEESVKFLRVFCKGVDHFYQFYYGSYACLNEAYSDKISQLVNSMSVQKIAVWGAGLKGQAFLLKGHRGVNENIHWIVDINEKLWGKEICGIPIVSFDMIRDEVETILVMNYIHFMDIKSMVDEVADSHKINIINLEEYLIYGTE